MRPEEMVALAKQALAAAGQSDREATLRTFHPQVTFVTIADWPDGGEFRGHDAVWGFIRSFISVFEGTSFQLDNPVVDGDRLVAGINRPGTGGKSGAHVEPCAFRKLVSL